MNAIGAEFDVFGVGVSSADYGVGRRKRIGFGEISRVFNVEKLACGGAKVASARAGEPSENICNGRHKDNLPRFSLSRKLVPGFSHGLTAGHAQRPRREGSVKVPLSPVNVNRVPA